MALSFPADFRVTQIKSVAVTVGTSATQVDTASNTQGIVGFIWVAIYNNSSNTIYYGGDNTVATSTGFPLAAGDSAIIPASDHALFDLWAVAASAGSDVRALFLK